jgi:hypothetical protein
MTGTKETSTPPRKRLFISLMGFTCLIVVGLIFLAWWVPNRGLANIHPRLPHIVGIAVVVLSGVAILGTGLLVLTTALGKDIFFTRFMRLVVIKFLLPMIELVGRGLGLDKDSIQCVQCGRCDIKGLVGIGRKYHVDISVATGGTLARKVIVEKRPKLVLAVACERDLTSGIKDCYPLPVIGILNNRPFGPCFNTTVDTAKIDEALSQVIIQEETASTIA